MVDIFTNIYMYSIVKSCCLAAILERHSRENDVLIK